MEQPTNTEPRCLACDQTSDVVPLINVKFRGQDLWICPQHLPILIHRPAQLADRLPGAENLSAADHGH
ncbi:MAG: hypothetical protein WBH90_14085 [Aggregatilineales bacterium]|jgi:hypothetical protein|nr:hypothetical protein [Chloroflexota bacterium]HOA24681.1 hypothetical protein [Aggregatilineales bacterium]HPV08783.1 hypothetical protein [Aggregatilineales bacterium]HQE18201.1 hypothetical protein [Aggregatilineales bacterium]